MSTTTQKPDVKEDEEKKVDTAGDDSFPASDPPAFTPVTGPAHHQKEKSAINDNPKDDPLKKSQKRHQPKVSPECCS